MLRTIRARFRNRVFEPVEPVELPEGTDVKVTIELPPTQEDIEAFRSAAGSWRETMPDADTLIQKIYRSRRRGKW